MGWRERATPVSSGGGWRSRATPVPSADNAVPQGGPGFLSQAGSAARRLMDSPAYSTSPSSMLQRVPELASQAFGKAGEFAAEQMGREGANPRLAAGVGTAISIAPDVAMMASPVGEKINAPKQILRPVSRPLAQRSLGITKRFLNTPFARREADLAAQVALERDVIPMSGSPEKAFSNATRLNSESGQKIGGTLKKIEFEKIAPDAELDLENFRKAITKGTERGLFSSANGPIDNVKTTILELYGRDVSAKEYNEAKNILGNSINYLADQASQSVNKRLVNTMANTIRESVKKAVPDSYQEFLANQRTFNASKMMLRGLNNELAGQAGNNAVSLPTMVLGAGQMATGNAPGAMATLGVVEGLRRRGAGASARALEGVDRFAERQLGARRRFSSALGGSGLVGAKRILKEKPSDQSGAPQSVLDAGKNVKRLFNDPQGRSEGISSSSERPMTDLRNYRNEKEYEDNQNGNFKRQQNQDAPLRVLSEQDARKYLKKASGDKAKARQLALADGWMIP